MAKPPQTERRLVVILCLLVGLLGMISAGLGLLWRGTGVARPVTSIYGSTVELYGKGLYRNDSLFAAGNNRATDLVMILLGLPLLATSLMLYARGSFRGRLLLLGTVGFFLYVSASYALGAVAFNELFLLYVALFSASLFAFLAVFRSFGAVSLTTAFPNETPRRWPGVFLIAAGIVTLIIWLMEPLQALTTGEPPATLETRTTLFTNALDIAVIVPAAVLAGVLILRRVRFGYVIAFSLLVLLALLMPTIAIATAVQVRLGIEFEPAEIIGPIAGLSVFGLLSIWVMVSILRHVGGGPVDRTSTT